MHLLPARTAWASQPVAICLTRLLPLSILQISFPFKCEQHEVHSLRSLADTGLVGLALAGKCGPLCNTIVVHSLGEQVYLLL